MRKDKKMELPSNYLEEMKELLGDQYEAYLASFEQKTRQGLLSLIHI